ncbi:PQQ-binding-like beta-propeller repeat protein [Haloarchaeobius sp. DFWS5]|uniref:outer membrane protein assembly factor BamB family protein n=1 Tax=Haloarchaeobius sp. DFWS5 TaxID=3446114 RepID=UPI003EB7E9C0
MNRRRLLQRIGGLGAVGSAVGLAGCGQLVGDDTSESNTGRAEACGPYEPTVTGSPGWQSAGGDPAGTGVVPTAAAPEPPLSLDWTFTLGGMAGAGRPVATADRVYAHEMDTTLFAVDAVTGEKVWERSVDGPYGSPAIGDGVVVALGNDTVLGLDPATGETQWTGPEGHADLFQGNPVVVDETVYVPTELSLLALDAGDGSIKWEHATGHESDSTPAILGETVYYGGTDTYVYALDAATGEERWRYKTNAHIYCNVSVAAETVFVGSRDGLIHAIDAATAERAWTYDTKAEPHHIATDGSHVYVDTEGHVRALEASTGTSCWSTSYEDHIGTGIAVGDGHVYTPLERIGAKHGGLPSVLDAATGETLAQTQGEFESTRTSYDRGLAVVDGAVYTAGLEEDGISLARFS